MNKISNILFALLFMQLFLYACIDQIEPETITFESALVIEATITDELKTQEIFLSRTFEFEADGPRAESNAEVEVLDDLGNRFRFLEASPGRYISDSEFSAMAGRSYSLQIATNDGRSYSSEATDLPASTQIDSLYAERIVNDNGLEGIGIFVDSFDPTGNSQNYRYTYDETYRIIAPDWNRNTLIGDPEGGCNVIKVDREREEQTCYRTDNSTDIIQINTIGFDEDRLSRFLVRFISRENYIISHRYTILVRQLIQSDASFIFYETLKNFSGSESLFSDTQPGFLSGNVFSDLDQEEKVLGYFEIATVNEKRIFFNYEDFFPGEPLPPYIDPCMLGAPPLAVGLPPRCILRDLFETDQVRLINENIGQIPGGGPYLTVPRVCGDCTVLGSTEVPEFWTED